MNSQPMSLPGFKRTGKWMRMVKAIQKADAEYEDWSDRDHERDHEANNTALLSSVWSHIANVATAMPEALLETPPGPNTHGQVLTSDYVEVTMDAWNQVDKLKVACPLCLYYEAKEPHMVSMRPLEYDTDVTPMADHLQEVWTNFRDCHGPSSSKRWINRLGGFMKGQ